MRQTPKNSSIGYKYFELIMQLNINIEIPNDQSTAPLVKPLSLNLIIAKMEGK